MALQKPFNPIRSLSYFVMIALALAAVCDVFSIVIGIAQIVSPTSSVNLDGEGDVSTWLMIQGLIYLLDIPIYIFTVVMFLIWLHRAHSNLEALNARNLEFTPGWAVGWWFIPFANLVKPFQVVREVWFESDPEFPTERVFFSDGLKSAPTYIGVWWAMWLLSNFAANVTSRAYDPNTMANVAITGYLFILTAALSIAAAVLAIMVVRDITDRQEARLAEVSHRSVLSDVPPPPPIFDKDL